MRQKNIPYLFLTLKYTYYRRYDHVAMARLFLFPAALIIDFVAQFVVFMGFAVLLLLTVVSCLKFLPVTGEC